MPNIQDSENFLENNHIYIVSQISSNDQPSEYLPYLVVNEEEVIPDSTIAQSRLNETITIDKKDYMSMKLSDTNEALSECIKQIPAYSGNVEIHIEAKAYGQLEHPDLSVYQDEHIIKVKAQTINLDDESQISESYMVQFQVKKKEDTNSIWSTMQTEMVNGFEDFIEFNISECCPDNELCTLRIKVIGMTTKAENYLIYGDVIRENHVTYYDNSTGLLSIEALKDLNIYDNPLYYLEVYNISERYKYDSVAIFNSPAQALDGVIADNLEFYNLPNLLLTGAPFTFDENDEMIRQSFGEYFYAESEEVYRLAQVYNNFGNGYENRINNTAFDLGICLQNGLKDLTQQTVDFWFTHYWSCVKSKNIYPYVNDSNAINPMAGNVIAKFAFDKFIISNCRFFGNYMADIFIISHPSQYVYIDCLNHYGLYKYNIFQLTKTPNCNLQGTLNLSLDLILEYLEFLTYENSFYSVKNIEHKLNLNLFDVNASLHFDIPDYNIMLNIIDIFGQNMPNSPCRVNGIKYLGNTERFYKYYLKRNLPSLTKRVIWELASSTHYVDENGEINFEGYGEEVSDFEIVSQDDVEGSVLVKVNRIYDPEIGDVPVGNIRATIEIDGIYPTIPSYTPEFGPEFTIYGIKKKYEISNYEFMVNANDFIQIIDESLKLPRLNELDEPVYYNPYLFYNPPCLRIYKTIQKDNDNYSFVIPASTSFWYDKEFNIPFIVKNKEINEYYTANQPYSGVQMMIIANEGVLSGDDDYNIPQTNIHPGYEVLVNKQELSQGQDIDRAALRYINQYIEDNDYPDTNEVLIPEGVYNTCYMLAFSELQVLNPNINVPKRKVTDYTSIYDLLGRSPKTNEYSFVGDTPYQILENAAYIIWFLGEYHTQTFPNSPVAGKRWWLPSLNEAYNADFLGGLAVNWLTSTQDDEQNQMFFMSFGGGYEQTPKPSKYNFDGFCPFNIIKNSPVLEGYTQEEINDLIGG